MKNGKISLITIYTLSILMLIVFGGKGIYSMISVQAKAVAARAETGGSNGINSSKDQILTNLSAVIHTNEGNVTDSTTSILYSTLEEYFTHEEVKLTNRQAERILEKINKLDDIIQDEHVTEVSKMSLGGQLSFMELMERIYNICGLQLSYNLKGTVYGIENSEGQMLYYKDIQTRWSFPFAELMALFLVCSALAIIPYLVARKNKYCLKTEAWNMLHMRKKEWKKA